MSECEKIIREINGLPYRIRIYKLKREYIQIIYFKDKYWRDLSGKDLNYLIRDAKELFKSPSFDLSDMDFTYSILTEDFIKMGTIVWDSDNEL